MTRERLVALCAWAVVVIALLMLFGPKLSPENAFFFRDHSSVYRRLFTLIREAYRAGDLPLWDPLIGGGEPLAAFPTAVPYSPLHIFTVLLPQSLDPYDFVIVALYVVGGAGAYVLAGVIGLDARSKLTAALLFGLGGPLISMNNLLPLLHGAAFGPWAMAGALSVWRRSSARSIAGLAVALALHAQGSDPSFLLCDVIVFLALAQPIESEQTVVRRFGALGVAAVLGVALAMIQILPLLDLLRSSLRATGYAQDVSWPLSPGHLLEISLPGIAGDFLELHTLFSTEGGRHYIASIYVSAIAIPCVFIALAVPRARPAVAAIAICVLLSLGDATPLVGLAKSFIPGVSASRFPVKYVYGIGLALPMVVPMAIHHLLQPAHRRSLYVLVAWIVLCALGPLIPGAWWLAHVPNYGISAEEVELLFAGACGQALTIAAVMSGLIWAARRSPIVAWALPAVLAIDLSLAANRVLPTIDTLPTVSPLAALVKKGEPRPTIFRYPSPGPPLDMRSDTLRGFLSLEPMGASPFGIRHIADFDLNDFRPERWRAVQGRLMSERDEAKKLRFLARLGTTHLLVSTRRRDLPNLHYVGTSSVPASLPISVFRIDGARSYLSLASHVRRVTDLNEAIEAMTSSVAPAGEVTITDDIEVSGEGGRVEDHGRDELEVHASGPGLLVVIDRYDIGWRARIDGQESRVVAVDAMLIGVPVPAGDHRIEVFYQPRSVTIGASVSATAALVILLLLVWKRRGQVPRQGSIGP